MHLSGGVGIGGVLEPPGARPVIIEDGAFIGSRCIVVEGVRVGREAVLGAERRAHLVDADHRRHRPRGGRAPRPRAGARGRDPGHPPEEFPAASSIACALIIGQRSESTDQKTSLNDGLRDFGVSA